jgi:hypothetical protein
MIKANYFRSSIRRHGTSNRKFSHLNRFILKKNSPACTTDAVLRKYGDTSARCTSIGPYFNNGNQNPFYIELAQTENYYGERLRNPVLWLKLLTVNYNLPFRSNLRSFYVDEILIYNSLYALCNFIFTRLLQRLETERNADTNLCLM